MNRIAIVCESLTGNTAMLAEALRAHLQSKNSYVTSPVLADADSSDVFFIGSGKIGTFKSKIVML